MSWLRLSVPPGPAGPGWRGAPTEARRICLTAPVMNDNDSDQESPEAGLPWLCTTSSVQQQETEEMVARYIRIAEEGGLELAR